MCNMIRLSIACYRDGQNSLGYESAFSGNDVFSFAQYIYAEKDIKTIVVRIKSSSILN